MTIYRRGDVILVEIAFSGAVGSKRRPAVVISVEAFNRAGIKLIVAAVTGNVSPPFRPGDTLLNDWSAGGLLKPWCGTTPIKVRLAEDREARYDRDDQSSFRWEGDRTG
jgi:PemK-like, MazF-like toxin of type II toxin-antitoxin system